MYKKIVAVLLLSVLQAGVSHGAGFALYEFSARSTAMGGATMANGAEPASLATNPALITELDGTQVQVGVTAVSANAKTTIANVSSRELKDDLWLLPNFYVTHKVSDDISFGLGGFSRYGLGGEYKNWQTWPGSQLAYKVKLETFSFTPTIAVKANDEFSVAMGLEAMVLGFSQGSTLSTANPGAAEATAYELSGSGVSWGGNFSFIYKPEWAEKWSLGGMYRTKVKQTANGRIDAGMEVPNTLYSGDAKGSISLPDSISAGLAFEPNDCWTFEAGIIGTFWSAYDQILVEYTDMEAAPTIHNKKDYKDVYRLNIGAEYRWNDNWSTRAGYVYDQSPINPNAMDTLVPVDNRHITSLGVGYKTDIWSLDFAYAHIFGSDLQGHTITGVPIKYSDGKSDMFGLTFGYKF